MADPEEWVNEEDKENEQWEYELRVRSRIPQYLSVLNGTALRRTRPHDTCDAIPGLRCPFDGIHIQGYDW